MKIVCDTNVLISGVLFGGHARRILALASRGMVTNHLSPAILHEFEAVLSRPKFGLAAEQILAIVDLVRDSFQMMMPQQHVDAVAKDPDDNRILETAVESGAQFVISGDNHLLELQSWQGIDIVSPADFIDLLDKRIGSGNKIDEGGK